jgi:hypothetical protein
MPTVRRIVRQAASDNYRVKSIVLGIVSTDAFRKREGDVVSKGPNSASGAGRDPRSGPGSTTASNRTGGL